MLNYLKWVSIILVSLFFAWLIPILFSILMSNAYKSLPQDIKDQHIKEMSAEIVKSVTPLAQKMGRNLLKRDLNYTGSSKATDKCKLWKSRYKEVRIDYNRVFYERFCLGKVIY